MSYEDDYLKKFQTFVIRQLVRAHNLSIIDKSHFEESLEKATTKHAKDHEVNKKTIKSQP